MLKLVSTTSKPLAEGGLGGAVLQDKASGAYVDQGQGESVRSEAELSSAHELTVEKLYNMYHPSLFNYLLGLCPGGHEEALEILHETYVRLLRLDNLDHLEKNPRAYIFTIATNLVRDELRRRVSRKADIHDDVDDYEFESPEPSPMDLVDCGNSLDRLKQALSQLPDLTRQIFLLSRFDDKTYPQIAEQLDISTRTVERHMSNAMKALQTTFEDLL